MRGVLVCGLLCTGCIDWASLSPAGNPDSGTPDGGIPEPLEGFGSATPAGTGQAVFHVTTLSASGAGSLREALSAGHRTVVFDVAGTITTASPFVITVDQAFLTIDGTSAPSPGITIAGGAGLYLEGTHDVVVRGLRVRGSLDDAFRVFDSRDVVVDHCAAAGAGDGNIDITENSQDVTVQWSVFHHAGGPTTPSSTIIAFGARRVSVHHTFYAGPGGNPLVAGAVPAGETSADLRNNLVWNWGASAGSEYGYGMEVDSGGRANVVGNYFETHGTYAGLASRALQIDHNGNGSQVHAALNVSGNGVAIDGNTSTPFVAPAITTQATCDAARGVLAQAGVRPLDGVDLAVLGQVALTACPP